MSYYKTSQVMKREELIDKYNLEDIHCVAPAGNMAGVNPYKVMEYCEKHGYAWFSYGCVYTSGILFYMPNDEWLMIRSKMKN